MNAIERAIEYISVYGPEVPLSSLKADLLCELRAMRPVTDEELRACIAQAWCTDDNRHKEMDIVLADAIFHKLRDRMAVSSGTDVTHTKDGCKCLRCTNENLRESLGIVEAELAAVLVDREHTRHSISASQAELVIAKLEKAHTVVVELCQQKRQWIMSIPARPNDDPDLIIGEAIRSAITALRTQSAGTCDLHQYHGLDQSVPCPECGYFPPEKFSLYRAAIQKVLDASEARSGIAAATCEILNKTFWDSIGELERVHEDGK